MKRKQTKNTFVQLLLLIEHFYENIKNSHQSF
jgi:hypothetical protein